MEYRFHLEKYKPGGSNRYECPRCGRKKCFTRYIDEEGEVEFPDDVGKCEHINTCQYHYTPKQYFADHPWARPSNRTDTGFQPYNRGNNSWGKASARSKDSSYKPATPTADDVKFGTTDDTGFDTIDESWLNRSMEPGYYESNLLFVYLATKIGRQETLDLFSRYRVGTSSFNGGSCVFWLTDSQGKIRDGKIMTYDNNGHRLKQEGVNAVTWVHCSLKLHDFRFSMCFFGEHLLTQERDKPVGIVESEKTALVAAHYMPDKLWLATGGSKNCMKPQIIRALEGRSVTLYPDLGQGTMEWQQKLPLFLDVCSELYWNDFLQNNADAEQINQGLDAADFLLREKILQPQDDT